MNTKSPVRFIILITLGLLSAGLSFLTASDDTLSAPVIMQKARETHVQFAGKIKSFQYKLYRHAFFEIYDAPTARYKAKGVLQTHTEVYRKYPDRRKEIETARRHIYNLPYDQYTPYYFSLIEDLASDAIPAVSASVPGPLSPQAARYYRFTLEGTHVLNDTVSAYKIRMEPLSAHVPAMKGSIFITTGTYQVAALDITFNEAVKIWPPPDNFRLSQIYAPNDEGQWFPLQMDYEYTLAASVLGIGGKARWHAMQRVYDYRVNPELPDSRFSGPYREILREALYRDSAYWAVQSLAAFSEQEQDAFTLLAQLPNNRKYLHPDIEAFEKEQRSENIHWGFKPLPDIRYNRVEGLFAGGEITFENLSLRRYIRDLTLTGRFGYGFSDKRYKGSGEASKGFFARRLRVGGRYYDDIRRKELPMAGSTLMNSLTAIGYRYDNFNYFYARGWEGFVTVKPFYNTELTATYISRDDRSTVQTTRWGIVPWLYTFKPVYPINQGHLNQIAGQLYCRFGRGKTVLSRETFYTLEQTLEHTNTGWLKSDFNFTKYYAMLRFHIPTTRRGSWDGRVYFGYATEAVPRQYLFDLYGSATPYTLHTVSLGDLEGNYMAALCMEHSFGGEWLERTGLPLLRDGYIDLVPMFSVGYIRASTETSQNLSLPVQNIKRPIYEVGLGLGDVFRVWRIDFNYRLNQRRITETPFSVTLMAFLFSY